MPTTILAQQHYNTFRRMAGFLKELRFITLCFNTRLGSYLEDTKRAGGYSYWDTAFAQKDIEFKDLDFYYR